MKSQFFRSCCVRGCAVLLGATLLLTSVGGMNPSALAESDAYKGTQYSTVIVLINSGTSMELGELEKDERIGAILWVSMPGASGFGPIGRILNGEVNPSGRTVDTWAADFKADPTWENFCKNNANATKLDADGNVLPEYLDASGNVVTNQLYDESGALVTSKYQIAYEEGDAARKASKKADDEAIEASKKLAIP